jgi:hypothetical protein
LTLIWLLNNAKVRFLTTVNSQRDFQNPLQIMVKTS